MPTSNYEEVRIVEEDEDGVITPIGSGETVEIHDLDADASLGSEVTNSMGAIPAGTAAVDAGTRIAFRIENKDGLAGSEVQITT